MSDNHQTGSATAPLSGSPPAVRKDDPQVFSFNEARAIKEGDSHLWTPREAVEKLLRDIVEGRINPTVMYVCMSESVDGRERMVHYAAGGSNMEYAGLLTYHQFDLANGGE